MINKQIFSIFCMVLFSVSIFSCDGDVRNDSLEQTLSPDPNRSGAFQFLDLDGEIMDIVTAPDGKVYLSGNFSRYGDTEVNHLIRVHENGELDTSFLVEHDFGSEVSQIERTSNDEIYAAGLGVKDRLKKLNNLGKIDSNFTSNPCGSLEEIREKDRVHQMAVTPDNQLLIMGGQLYSHSCVSNHFDIELGYDFALTKLKLDGRFDTSFRFRYFYYGCDFCWITINQMQVFSNGKVFLVGTFINGMSGSGTTPGYHVFGYEPNGNLIGHFINDNGWDKYIGLSDEAWAIDQDSEGNLIVGGHFENYCTSEFKNEHYDGEYVELSSPGIARLTYSNGFDRTFEVESGAGPDPRFNPVRTVKWTELGIYAGGEFTEFNGKTVGHIVRLDQNGKIDPTFSTGTGFDGPVHRIESTTDGSGDIYVLGDFQSYNGEPHINIVRLNSNGEVD